MPSGRVHNLINLAAFTALGGAALMLGRSGVLDLRPPEVAAFSLGFLAGTFLLSPDLDLAEGHVNSKRAWGLLGVLWVPYGKLFSHRGWSHSWLVGPLTRLAYLALIILILAGLARLALPGMTLPGMTLPHLGAGFRWAALPLLAGYYGSQWLHLIADGIRPDHKMRFRRR